MSYIELTPTTPVNTAMDQMNATAAKADTALQATGFTLTGAVHSPTSVEITSATGVVTLTEASNSFVVNGAEAVTGITGWTQGTVTIRWNTARVLTHSASLILSGSLNKTTVIGDVGVYEIVGTTAREIGWLGASADVVVGGLVGVVDNIVNGMVVTAGTGLSADIEAGRGIIDETAISFDAGNLALDARMATLVYAKKDGTYGKVNASFPTVSTQTLRYILDGSATIENTGVGGTNAITKTGTVTATDGRIGYSGLGSTTGYYVAASNTGVPAFTSDATRILVIDNFVSNSAIQIFHNDGISKFGCTAANNLTVNGVDTGFTLENGGAYKIALPSTASTTSASVYVNGFNVATGTYVVNTAAVAPTLYSGATGASKSPSQLAYFEYYATKLMPAQIASISNALLFPCSYDDVDIRSILPADSISLGYAKTNSTDVIEIDSDSYKYGIRQGATGGNRRVFLGWQYFSGMVQLLWDNPFGTRKVRKHIVWAQDSYGTNECDVTARMQSGGTEYGVDFGSNQSPSKRITAYTLNGGVCLFNNAWCGSGFLGCYAEVIE